MGAFYYHQALRLLDSVEGDPQRQPAPSEAGEGLILVPGRRRARAWHFLDILILEQSHFVAAQQPARSFSYATAAKELLVFGNVLPRPVILDARAGRFVAPREILKEPAGVGDVTIDAAVQQIDIVRSDKVTQADGTIAPEVLNVAVPDHHAPTLPDRCEPGPSQCEVSPFSALGSGPPA